MSIAAPDYCTYRSSLTKATEHLHQSTRDTWIKNHPGQITTCYDMPGVINTDINLPVIHANI